MTINYTNLLGLAKPVTGTETGQWGDVVNDEITELVEDAIANASSISVTSGDVTLTTTAGSANQARMSTLIITGSPGVTRNIIAPSQAKTYVVINQSNASVVIKGSATTGVTVGTNQTAQVAWNGSDFVEIGNYVHGNFVVNGNLSVNGDSTLGDGGADTSTVNGLLVAANSNISKAAALTTSAPAFAWIKGATYTDTASSGTIAHAPFNLITAPTLSTSNVTTYTNASTLYISGAPSAAGSATITNAAALFIAGGGANITGSVRSQAAATQDALVIAGRAGGTSSYATTLTPGTLTASNTLTLPIGTTTLAGLGTAQTFSATQTFSAAVTMSGTTTNISIGTSQTTGTTTIGGTAQTGTLTFGRSTGAQTLDIGVGATTSGTTKTINFGTAGVSGSTTNLNYGSAVSGATVTHTWSSGANSMTLDSSGRLLLGTTTTTNNIRLDEKVAIVGVNVAYNGMALTGYTGTGNAAYRPVIDFNRSRGTTDGSMTVLANNDYLGSIIFRGSDGTSFQDSAMISAEVDGTPGASDMPGRLTFWTSPDGSTSVTERMRLDSSGNLGLGVTPSAWGGIFRPIQIGTGGSFITGRTDGTPQTQVGANAYFNGTNWIYVNSSQAGRYSINGAAHEWYTAASGTAGNTISFTQAMTLDASGNLGVGATSPLSALDIYRASGANVNISHSTSGGTYPKASGIGFGATSTSYSVSSNGGTVSFYGGAGIYAENTASSGNPTNLVFWTNLAGTPAERARITSGGFFKASDSGTYIGSTGAYHELVSSTGGATAAVYIRNTNATSPAGIDLSYSAASPNGTGNTFLYCQDSTALRMSVRSNGGIANYSANDVNLSDRREKTNFAPAKSYLETICAIPVQTFNYIDQSEDDPGLTLGVVAQDVQAVAPELVMESNWGTEDNPKMRLSIYQTDLQYALMKCIQEQQTIIQSLTARIAALESKGA
jgi:hypothetical protein